MSYQIPSQQPTERIILSLVPENDQNPPSLEEFIVEMIQETLSNSEPMPNQSSSEWIPVDSGGSETKAPIIEARLFHDIDEISSENQQRVQEREKQKTESLKSDQRPSVDLVEAAKRKQRLRDALARLQAQGVSIGVTLEEIPSEVLTEVSVEALGSTEIIAETN
jgi:hypothetical protein